MNLFRICFEELYRRHLCRHGHFGLNVLHLLAVFGVYVGLLGTAGAVIRWLRGDLEMTLVALIVPWMMLVVVNCPFRVTLSTAVTMFGLLMLYLQLPAIPWWLWLVAIVASHHFQQWGHTIYRMDKDMSAFAEKYPKGKLLFLTLAIYELPILLNYLAFGQADWVWGREEISDGAAA